MSLVEVIVAVIVLGIVSSAVLGIVMQAQAAGVNNRSRIAASNLAAREIDIVREEFGRDQNAPMIVANQGTVTNGHPIAGGTVGQPLVVDGQRYTVVRSVAWNVTGDGQSACEGGSLVTYPTLQVTVTVTWPNMGSTRPVVTSAQLTPPKGAGVPATAAFVAVAVVDAAGDPAVGRSVRVSSASEVRNGTTDSSGCAVIQVNPAVGGTAFTAELTDSGYVSIDGSPNPSKAVGTMTPGQLNSSVSFTYDLAASLTIRVVDAAGNQVPDATLAAGTSVTVVSVGSTGAEVTSTYPISSAVTTLSSLWPSTYGAYYGATAPAGGYGTVALGPGGSATLDVVLEMATTSVTDLPPGTTTVVAVPQGQSCTASAPAVDPAGFAVVPGPWTLYTHGQVNGQPGYTCSPGPTVSLGSGANDGIVWAPSTLRVTGAPAAGRLFAVSASLVSGGLGTACPGPAYAASAWDVDAARNVPIPMPAGDWYVFRTDGAPGGACLGTPSGHYAKQLPYGVATTIPWTEVVPVTSLTLTSVTSGRFFLVSTAPVTSCTTTGYSTSGTSVVSSTASPSNSSSLSLNVNRPATGNQTWYAYVWKKTSTASCTAAGQFVVGPASSSLTKAASSTGSVGP